MDPVGLFAELIAQRRKVRADIYAEEPAYLMLSEAGLVEETGVVSSVVCDECSTPHEAEVVFEDRRYGYFCPEFGFVEKRRADLVEIRPNTAKLVVQIASELGCRRLKNKPISGNIWRVGAVETLAGELVIYFQPTLRSGQDLIDLENALAHEVRGRFGIVLTAERGLSHPPLKTIAIEDCLGFDPSACVFTFEADLLTLKRVAFILPRILLL